MPLDPATLVRHRESDRRMVRVILAEKTFNSQGVQDRRLAPRLRSPVVEQHLVGASRRRQSGDLDPAIFEEAAGRAVEESDVVVDGAARADDVAAAVPARVLAQELAQGLLDLTGVGWHG